MLKTTDWYKYQVRPTLSATIQSLKLKSTMSSASIVGIAILESPVTVAGHPTTLHFDAQFWLGFDKPVLSASLQYYNGNGLTFEDGGEYFVYANVRDGF